METSKLGMPSARPFTTDGAATVFVLERGSLLNVAGRSQLAEIGVDYDTAAEFEGKSVYGFSASELETLLSKTETVVVERFGSTKTNVEWVRPARQNTLSDAIGDEFEVAGPMPAYPVQVIEWRGGESEDAFAYLASRLLGPAVGRKILLYADESSTVRDYDERGGFQIHIWSTPCYGARQSYAPTRIWGNRVESYTDAFLPQPAEISGVPIMDDSYMVAELYPNALFVHHNLAYSDSVQTFNIMRKICDEAAFLLKNEEVFAARLNEAKARFEENQKRIFSSLVRRSIPERANRSKEKLEPTRERIRGLREELFAAQRELFAIEHAQFDSDTMAAKFTAEIEKLQRGEVAHIERIDFAGTRSIPKLHLYTSEIIATDPQDERRYLLGRYRIVIDFTDSSLLFFNMDRLVDGCHGPHIFHDGTSCLGNLEYDMQDYIAHYEVGAIAMLAVAFLQSPNTRDQEGRRVRDYPPLDPPIGDDDEAEEN